MVGPAKNRSNEIAQWILKGTMNILSRRTLLPLIEHKNTDVTIIAEREHFMEKCGSRIQKQIEVVC